MPASPKATPATIVGTLTKWKGNVVATAADLGMSTSSLYERIHRLGIRLEAYREGLTGITGTDRESPGPTGVPPRSPQAMQGADLNSQASQVVSGITGAVGAHKSVSDRVQKREEAPKFPAMQTGTAATLEEEERDVPIKTEPKRERPLRLRPDLRERLQRAAWRLQAHFGEPTNENLILEQLVEETLDGWEKSKLEPPPASAPMPAVATRPSKKKTGGEDGGR